MYSQNWSSRDRQIFETYLLVSLAKLVSLRLQRHSLKQKGWQDLEWLSSGLSTHVCVHVFYLHTCTTKGLASEKWCTLAF